ncbi:hypothetical protein JIN84_12030 [Luteolibacter yonseiensis]|uniref:Uncharacterized protein n=1 Tax=Luteolibacter yonseiensis TaxID=1144680 RepID=A0A934R6J8_9BACT|nr:hypothetical protein [Luteolibacter yonseiensis]MBK1816345.1 hypothetical protein [Luteolibacter yonseiensis]
MEAVPPPVTPPPYENRNTPAPKKGLGTGAMIGIGCGSVILLGIIAVVVVAVMFGGKLKKFGEEAQKNPTRATASLMVDVSGGKIKMVAEDDVSKRYTVQGPDGKLTTVYWDEARKAPVTIEGDFSAIPASPALPEPAEEPAK